MMRITNKLALVTAFLAIFSAVAVKPASAIDDDLSGQLIAQTFNDESFIEETSENVETARKVDDVPAKAQNSDESWILPVLWGLGGYLIGSLVGTNKTYTKMNKGR